jgi:hypothetical protein
MPGMPTVPGAAAGMPPEGGNNAGIPGAGGAGAGGQAPPAGTAEHAAFQFVSAITKGEFDATSEWVSPKATGTLKELRTKTLTESKKTDLKDKFGQPQLTNSKGVSGGKQLSLRNGTTLITLTIKKEGEDYKVADLQLRQIGKK